MTNMKISWIENKVSKAGATYAKATLIDNSGKEYTDVTIFENFPGFSELKPEGQIEGVLKESSYNGKTSWVLNAGNFAIAGIKKPAGIQKAMETKAANIEKAQENRAEGVKIASTFRDATLIALSECEANPELNFEDEWIKWRSWLWKNWEVDEAPF